MRQAARADALNKEFKKMRSLLLIVALAACSKDPCEGAECGTTKVAQALFVAREGELVSFDIATGEERPGTVQNVVTPVDLYAHENGWLTVNLTNATET